MHQALTPLRFDERRLTVQLCNLFLKILDKIFTAKHILYFAIISELFGLLLANLTNHLPTNIFNQILTWITAAPIAIGDVIIYSLITTFYSDAVSEHDQGKVMGINYIIVTIIWASTGIIGGCLAAININLPIIIAPLTLLLGIWALLRLKET